MTFHSGPEYVAPDEDRCEAVVLGQPSWTYDWMKIDHRCPRKANQMRGPRLVCWQHAKIREIQYVGSITIPKRLEASNPLFSEDCIYRDGYCMCTILCHDFQEKHNAQVRKNNAAADKARPTQSD